jgi:hypothetical protein
MEIRFTLPSSSYDCLLRHHDKLSTAARCLTAAVTETSDSGQVWHVLCSYEDVATILKIARAFCADAVPHIGRGLDDSLPLSKR